MGADCVCLDCEDGVAANRKAEARTTIVKLLHEVDFGASEPAVRINALETQLAEEDLKALLLAPKPPAALVVPKVDSAKQLEWVRPTLLLVERV